MLLGIVGLLVIIVICASAYLVGTRSPGAPSAAVSPTTVSAPDPGPTDAPQTTSDITGDEDLLSQSATITAPNSSADSVDANGDTTTFIPGNMTDGQSDTAWRMSGDGTGNSITIRWNHPVAISTVGLINGYAKVDTYSQDDRYSQERRIVQVTWSIDGQDEATQTLQDDDRDIQSIDLPQPVTGQELTLRIAEVTEPGDYSHDFTSISELEVLGQ